MEYSKSNPRRIDPEFKHFIEILNMYDMKTKACCCGHGRYHQTVVVESLGSNYELFSGKHIPRKKRFYRRDKDGYFYIPEVDKCFH